jgi:hypothetical protein
MPWSADDPELEVPMAHKCRALAVARHADIRHAQSFLDLSTNVLHPLVPRHPARPARVEQRIERRLLTDAEGALAAARTGETQAHRRALAKHEPVSVGAL